MGLCSIVPESRKGQVLVKRCGASGPTVEAHRNFGLGATGTRLLAPPDTFKALARTGPTVEKWLLSDTVNKGPMSGVCWVESLADDKREMFPVLLSVINFTHLLLF